MACPRVHRKATPAAGKMLVCGNYCENVALTIKCHLFMGAVPRAGTESSITALKESGEWELLTVPVASSLDVKSKGPLLCFPDQQRGFVPLVWEVWPSGNDVTARPGYHLYVWVPEGPAMLSLQLFSYQK